MQPKRHKPPGIPPGTLLPLEGAVVPTGMHVIHYTRESLEEADVASVAEVMRWRERKGVTWVNVDGLGDVKLLAALGEAFGLHPLALEDVLSVTQRPKVDAYEGHLYIVSRMLHYEKELETEQVSVFLGRDFVVTFQERPGDCLDPVRERLRKGAGQLRRQGADYLMYAIVDAIIDHYYPFLERLGEVVETLEDEVVTHPTRGTIAAVHAIKRDLLSVRRCVWPLREAVNALIRDENPLLGRMTRLYLRDCYDHTVQMLEIVETYRELAGGLMDVYLSSLSNKLNEVMKVLTVISTIFIPLTFLAGIYGMNFDTEASPLNMPELRWRWGYVAFWIVCLVTAGVMLLLFRRKGWLGGADKG